MRFRLDNRSGYDTEDLRRFLARGFRAMVKPGSPLARKLEKGQIDVVVVSSPIRSRGCAEIGGRRLVIAIASPSRFSMRRLARLLWHESAHLNGAEHEDMPEDLLYSLGPEPRWAGGLTPRYVRRAPNQVVLLRSPPTPSRSHTAEVDMARTRTTGRDRALPSQSLKHAYDLGFDVGANTRIASSGAFDQGTRDEARRDAAKAASSLRSFLEDVERRTGRGARLQAQRAAERGAADARTAFAGGAYNYLRTSRDVRARLGRTGRRPRARRSR